MTRKEFLKKTGTLGAGMAAMTSCALIYDSEILACSLDELKAQPFLIREFNWDQIFLTMRGEEIVVFSLVCSHKKCTVAWQAREEQFACPCHEGLYDSEGRVIDGPPPAPLSRFRWELRGNDLWVINEKLSG
ncbi:MAG: ubiquinol-cytochrome c reductase iron-sulfur subunit [Bacteroidia bacterium]|nr:ubiquinol-cytochrome c reductase iron-sulfur subunit [Bacteroidia bacterium]